MGSTDKEEAGIADCGVGSIVWVRRRNGSWWPGKILGPEELSAAHLVSPRSGTPVKLLGREDASVDWYNLEKSKRVKPFRCGEFDECIEKAELALGMPPKKREKYARREDAILHALELEKQLLDDKSGNFGSAVDGGCNKSSDVVRKELLISSECSNHDITKNASLKPGLKKPVISTEDEDISDPIPQPEANGITQMEEGKNITEVLPRVSGLQDLGLRSAPTKQTRSSSTSLNGSHKLEVDSFDHDLPIGNLIYESSVIPGTRSSLEKKRKSANYALTNESLVKRRDRCRTLVQVLQKSEKSLFKSSVQLSGEEHTEPTSHAKRSRVYLPSESNDCSDDDQLVSPSRMAKSPSLVDADDFSRPTTLDEMNTSESAESTETDSSATHSLGSDVVGLADPALAPELEAKSLDISRPVRHGNVRGMMPNDDDMSHFYSHDSVPASLGVSKWQSKGKRNNRSFSRRSTEATHRWVARGSMYTADLEEVGSDGFDETDVIERNLRTQRRPCYNQGYASIPKTPFKGYDDVSHNIIDWEDLAWNEQTLMRGYWENTNSHLRHTFGSHQYGGRIKSGLLDVDLRVQSSYQRAHVPMISLMSKLNGKAIVGHPIQVQILEYGYTDSLLSSAHGIGLENPDDTAVPSAWKTARRSANFRVPRSQSSTKMEAEESIEHFQNVNHNNKMPFRNSGVGNFSHKSSVARKGVTHGKFSKKPPKKMTSSSNQKTRNLSAIGREQRFGNNFRRGNEDSFRVGGLIKGEVGPTTVACIPVKLVFCRLNEELVDHHQ